MKDAEAFVRELIAASIRLQECEYIANRNKRPDLAEEASKAGFIIASMMRKMLAPNCEHERVVS